ncbi:IS4 family transposase [Shewanella aestuarii]|uniref:IS4 family transposase n=1 Tax=Shewanella aestuarii TaxID=1028752 RepID=A0A6G9QKY9_9GAMM|nr:IS4 family transposase [Shewanella aestuarii]QIR13671.1 IS4 family transposase [Shewanella aestuarii]QIR14529.1 IS4 family transposase [Shewanella aestuarii]
MIDKHQQWAEQQFGQVNLGDPRRTSRLVKLASTLAANPGKPIVNISQSPADMEGAYRFIRNENIEASTIAEAGFKATATGAQQHNLLLALEDTTNIVYSHRSIREELGHINQGNRHRGLLAHSIVLFAPESSEVVGLIEQQRWTRDINTRGKRRTKTPVPYSEKESYKWERASRNMAKRLGDNLDKVISVCDREADIYDYLQYKLNNQQRFVVRSMMSRHIEEGEHKLFHYASELTSAGQKRIHIAQKAGRKARTATLDITFSAVTLKVPSNKKGGSLPVYYVGCEERGNSDSNLNWHLITNEPIHTKEDALNIVSHYEHRWLVEEYHKVWKTDGTDIESSRLQSLSNVERLVTINAFIATRILQLKFAHSHATNVSCEQVLTPKAWKLLWLKQIKTPLPDSPPNMHWAYAELAKLGGWKDTKRTGRASVKVLWQGWFKLQTILEGYELAKSLESNL